MKNFIKEFRWDAAYLGGSLAWFADLDFMQWQFWAIIVPFTILNVVINNKKEEEQ